MSNEVCRRGTGGLALVADEAAFTPGEPGDGVRGFGDGVDVPVVFPGEGCE
jgi:hypothetical protein